MIYIHITYILTILYLQDTHTDNTYISMYYNI